jgi:hypothetical protein
MAEEDDVPENILNAALNDGPIDFESGPDEWYTSGLADPGPFTLEDLDATWTFEGNLNLPLEPNSQALQENNQILEEVNQALEQENQVPEQDNQVLEEGSNAGASSRSPPSSPLIREGILSIFDGLSPSRNPTNNLQMPEGNLASLEGLFPSSNPINNLQMPEGNLASLEGLFPSSNPTNNLQIPEANLAYFEGLFPSSNPTNNLQIPEGNLASLEGLFPSSNPPNNLQIPEGNLASFEGLFPSSNPTNNLQIPEGNLASQLALLVTGQDDLENFDLGEEIGSPTNNFQNIESVESMFEDLLDPEGQWGRGELFPHLPGHELMEDDQLGPRPPAPLDNVNSGINIHVELNGIFFDPMHQ